MTAEPAPAAEGGRGLGPERPAELSSLRRLPALLMLPREHGAWIMLLIPYLLGTVAAGWAGWPSTLLLLAILALFSASRPLELTIQGRRHGALLRLAVYGLTGFAAGLGLLVLYERWILLPLGAVAGTVLASQLLFRMRRLERTWPARLASIAALSSTGPAAYYVASAALDRLAFAVWLLPFLYLGASVFYVRLYYRSPSKEKGSLGLDGRIAAERQMLAYLAMVLVATAALSVAGVLPPLGWIAFLPLAIKAAFGCRRRGSRPTLQHLGLTEVAHSLLFMVLAAVSIRMWS